MTEPTRHPRSRFEDEGIPDLQDGTPEAQWAEDPQELPLPGDTPVGVDRTGTTVDEQITGESLDEKLAREESEQPSAAARPTTSDELAYGHDVRDVDVAADELVPAAEAIPPTAEPAGRLVAPDEGVREDREKDSVADDVGPDTGGLSPEERAMRVEPER